MVTTSAVAVARVYLGTEEVEGRDSNAEIVGEILRKRPDLYSERLALDALRGQRQRWLASKGLPPDGSDREPTYSPGKAQAQVDERVTALMEKRPELARHEAIAIVCKADPTLYQASVGAHNARARQGQASYS